MSKCLSLLILKYLVAISAPMLGPWQLPEKGSWIWNCNLHVIHYASGSNCLHVQFSHDLKHWNKAQMSFGKLSPAVTLALQAHAWRILMLEPLLFLYQQNDMEEPVLTSLKLCKFWADKDKLLDVLRLISLLGSQANADVITGKNYFRPATGKVKHCTILFFIQWW